MKFIPDKTLGLKGCIRCGDRRDLVAYLNLAGDNVLLCRDGTSCTRREMAQKGIKLLPHPKNPERGTA